MAQLSFISGGFKNKGKVTKRTQFLAEMDQVVPWARLEALIAPVFPKGERGRPPLPLATMLRVYCLQQWFNLSDPAVEEALYDSEAMRFFAGIDGATHIVPDETTVLKFRRRLEKHELAPKLFGEINAVLAERGLIVGAGTIVDATIVHAPSSTKNQEGKRDPEMHQTKKGNQWYFGMKVHTGTDADTGVVHSITATAANVHDAQVLPELLHGLEQELYGDAAYQDKQTQALAEEAGIAWNVCERAGRGRNLTGGQKRRNRAISRIRAKGEHPYLVVKRLWGHMKVRYRGIAKNLAQAFMLYGLANLFMMRRHFLGARD
jgi:IS5 family transposase